MDHRLELNVFVYSVIRFINQNVQYNPLTPTVAVWVQL